MVKSGEFTFQQLIKESAEYAQALAQVQAAIQAETQARLNATDADIKRNQITLKNAKEGSEAHEKALVTEKELAAQVKAFVDERNKLIKSLREENEILDAQLSGPFVELEQAYEAQIRNLDEMIEQYEKSAKRNKKSAEVVAGAEEKKKLLTAKFLQERGELLDEHYENERRKTEEEAKEHARIEKEKMDAIARLRGISDGAEAESRDEKLLELQKFAQDQLAEAKFAYDELIQMGANEKMAFAAFMQEKTQINDEFHQNRRKLEDETAQIQREKRH